MILVGRGDSAVLLRKQLPKGTRVRMQWSLAHHPQMAISGNHFLVHDGIIRAVDDREMHPRTAVGVDADTGEVLLLVVDGRSRRSRGYTMVELAEPDGRTSAPTRRSTSTAAGPRRWSAATASGADRGAQHALRRLPALGVERDRDLATTDLADRHRGESRRW